MSVLQRLPSSAEAYGRAQRAEIGAAASAAARLWRRMGDEFDASYAGIEADLLAVLDTAQQRVAAGALEYIPAVLAETGQRVRPMQYAVAPGFMVGVSGDGLTTEGLAYGAVTRAKVAVATGAAPAEALASGGRWLSTAVGTLLSDTGRTAEKVAGHSRRVTTWVRMLEPPSCGRCVILAGKPARTGQPFLRHPKCDCRNIPASETFAGDWTTDPDAYLETLDDEGLRRALGSEANARAWRDGADTDQLINAYRRGGDVRTAQVYGRNVKYTTEGTTRRGRAYRPMQGLPGGRGRAPRLMPESIYQISTDREDAIRLLRLYGWI